LGARCEKIKKKERRETQDAAKPRRDEREIDERNGTAAEAVTRSTKHENSS
jgi:hypothetical protein